MSNHNQTESASIPHWVRRMPSLSPFCAPLPGLAEAPEGDHGAAVGRLAEVLGAPEEPMSVRIQIINGDGARCWLLDAGPAGCQVTRDADRDASTEAILDEETWALLASGRLSPLEAFALGRMRVRGDLRAAGRLARQLYRRDM